MERLIILVSLFLVLGCATSPKKSSWIIESDRVAEEFTKDFAEISPEHGSEFGYQEYDKLGSSPSEESEKKELEKLKKWKIRLEKELQSASSKNLKVDFGILLDNVNTILKWKEVEKKLGSIPFPQASKSVYGSLFQLINAQSPKKRKKDAVSRFKFYMSEQGKLNLVEAYLATITRNEEKYKGRKKFYPFAGAIKKYLSDSPSYVSGVKGMLEKSGRSDWKSEFELFEKEIKKYDSFINAQILPKARRKPMLPGEVYKLTLKQLGVSTDPDEMIEVGQEEYKKLYKRYRELAMTVGKSYGLKDKSPRSVIGHLKKNTISNPKEVEALYNSTADRLENIIREHDIVTLPSKPLKIRLAGEAESKATPVPHLNPPPLLNNDGIVPEFVVPTSKAGRLPFDDFSFKSAAAILTVHEGRPGHDLQFSRMLEIPISIIRARYAMNSVNAEGWGVFAEDLIYPYLTDEEKLVATQMRLWRIARYFLDPMVQLGKADEKKVINVFHNELGVSKVMAGLEYNRYAFRNPGQATAYYQGLINIRNIKQDFGVKIGQLNGKCFNDTLLSFGLLPHEKVKLFEESFKKCAH